MTKKNSSLFFLAILIIYSLFCLSQLGSTWDTFFYYELGKDRLDYLFSLGNDESFKRIPHSKFLPGAYSTIAAFFAQTFPKKYLVDSLYFFNFLFSFFAILGIYKISRELFNKLIGKVTFLICFFNPIFFGHMSINPNDTVLAFSNIWFFYLLIKYFKKQNNILKKNKYVLLSGLCLGLGVGIRSSFVVTTLPFFIFFILDYINLKSSFSKKFLFKQFFIDTLKVLAIAYFFMILFWPHTHGNIFTMPFKLALEGLSYGFGVPYIMLNGEVFLTEEFPKSYILKNLLFKLPEFIIISFFFFILFLGKISKDLNKKFKNFRLKIALIFFIILFPNLLILFSPYSPYDGIRFFLYLIPYICIIPAILIFFLLNNLKIIFYKIVYATLLFLIAFLIFNFFKLTPYQYVYLNNFAGKTSQHSNKFENDYWGVSTKKLISKIKYNDQILNIPNVKLATCGIEQKAQIKHLKKIKNLNFRMVNNNENYDFIIMNNRVVFDKKKDSKKIETCFQKFEGEDIIQIKARDLVISKITKKK